ncbi:Argininosuccinate lyase [compost metagenome]
MLYCINEGKFLLDLTLDEFKQFSPLFDDQIYAVLQPEAVVNARNVYGGTASVQVLAAIERAEASLLEAGKWVAQHANSAE